MKFILLLLLFYTNLAISQPNYDNFNALLQKNVNSAGVVNYKNLKANEAELRAVTDQFSAEKSSENWSKNERLAFWINSYNAFTLQLVVDNYPLKKITDLDGGKPWDVKRIDIGGEKYSLNQIENEIIRPKFKDARVHFALNCAAKSCPPLLNQVFLPATLDKQLASRTRQFVRSKNMDLAENSVNISKIFDWYKTDFGEIIAFLNKYSTVKIAPNATIEFKEYDWSLNGF
jgi:Protein of unknown function, DUF547